MRQMTTTMRRRLGAVTIVLAAVVGMLMLTTTGAARTDSGVSILAASGNDPSSVSFGLDGCRNNGGITLPNGSGDFICPDAAYTSGNLGKGWNELDLVPFRLTADAGNSAPATQTYDVVIALDNRDATRPGYDVISAPVLNTALSSAGCTAANVGSQLTTTGVGGIDSTIYRVVTITQPTNSTCVYDWYGRLALGSHLFPGSSLHANLLNKDLTSAGIGSKDVSIPVKEIAPQELTKDMSATQDSDHVWNLTKSPTPASVSFPNTCDSSASTSAAVSLTVSWTKLAATPSGDITVVTNIYAKNPAARVITLNSLTDVIYSGTTALDTATAGPIDLPANTTMLVLTHSFVVPAGTTNLNDIATGSYTDKVTGIAIPGTTTATASATVQPSGVELNKSASITDVESITGSGFTFSTDSFSGASGSFDGGYIAGTPTTGPVSWTSASQSGSGSATFSKTVYVTAGTNSSGSLADTATLTGSDGFTKSASASVSVSSSAQVALTVKKNIPNILSGSESQTFNFKIKDHNGVVVATPSLTFGAGDTTKQTTVSGLAPDNYTVSEDAATGWNAQSAQSVDLTLPTCSGTAEFTNTFGPADAKAVKVTVPTGGQSGWEMTLSGPGTPAGGEKVNTDANGNAPFTTVLQEGSYTIVETPKTGYDQTGSSGDCSFTVNYPADAGRHFVCTYTNTQRGHIIVKKLTNPAGSSQSFEFDPSYSGTNFFLTDTQTNDSGALVPGTYSVGEVNIPTGWDLTSSSCSDGSPVTAISLQAGETVTCTFYNRQRGHIIIKKLTDPSGSSQSFEFDPSYSASNFNLTDTQTNDSGALVPGTYSVAEVNIPSGWDLTGSSCTDGSPVTAISLQAGETVTCTFNNRQRGKAKVIKTFSGLAPTLAQSVVFQLRQGASAAAAGTILESQTANAGNGGILNFATFLVPGSTYQICEVLGPLGPGWTTTLGPPLYSVYNPSGDNSTVCTDFTVTSGQLKTFSIDNRPPPGGLAFTIGYWKNWSSCTGGGQKPVLDQTLLKLAQNGTPATLGLLVLNPSTLGASTACKYAVAILSKSTITGGKKMSSDPLFNMAAQLLAADLNAGAGSGQCVAATTAINQAHALLTKYSFDGNGYTPKLTTADANLANSLGTTLDRYNNNKLC